VCRLDSLDHGSVCPQADETRESCGWTARSTSCGRRWRNNRPRGRIDGAKRGLALTSTSGKIPAPWTPDGRGLGSWLPSRAIGCYAVGLPRPRSHDAATLLSRKAYLRYGWSATPRPHAVIARETWSGRPGLTGRPRGDGGT